MEPPTSPSSSSYPLPFSASKFASLPIMAMKEKIVEKIMENRVTLIVGETGCGINSSPSFHCLLNSTLFIAYLIIAAVFNKVKQFLFFVFSV